MVATIRQIIGKINPELYAQEGKKLLKKYKSADNIPAEEVTPQALKYSIIPGEFELSPVWTKLSSGGSEASHDLIYDSSSETLEPVYFFILDILHENGLDVEKLVDNFSPTPGSGHFGELSQRASIMQQQASKLLADVGVVMRGVLRIIYDLKEFRIRLQHYGDLNSRDENIKDAALLALKQVWMDKVDIAKGNSSIKAMALGVQPGFQTLIDAFLAAKDEKDVNKLDLNDRVKRILLPRIQEFKIWLKESGKELMKRYALEKTYLKSQVNNLKLYARWAKPYLLAARDLEQKEVGREPAFVKVFNTIILELTLLGKTELNVKESAIAGALPKDFEKLRTKRKYYSCVLVNFKFRGIPQKVGAQHTHYAFGGRSEVTFSAYALSEDELKKLDEELAKADVDDVLSLIEGATTESLEELQEEINFFLEEKSEEEQTSKSRDNSNPFAALFGKYGEKPEKKKPILKEEEKPIGVLRPDDFIEKTQLREVAGAKAITTAFKLFDVYKKAHNMASFT